MAVPYNSGLACGPPQAMVLTPELQGTDGVNRPTQAVTAFLWTLAGLQFVR